MVKTIKCEKCGKSGFKSRRGLTQHMNTCNGVQNNNNNNNIIIINNNINNNNININNNKNNKNDEEEDKKIINIGDSKTGNVDINNNNNDNNDNNNDNNNNMESPINKWWNNQIKKGGRWVKIGKRKGKAGGDNKVHIENKNNNIILCEESDKEDEDDENKKKLKLLKNIKKIKKNKNWFQKNTLYELKAKYTHLRDMEIQSALSDLNNEHSGYQTTTEDYLNKRSSLIKEMEEAYNNRFASYLKKEINKLPEYLRGIYKNNNTFPIPTLREYQTNDKLMYNFLGIGKRRRKKEKKEKEENEENENEESEESEESEDNEEDKEEEDEKDENNNDNNKKNSGLVNYYTDLLMEIKREDEEKIKEKEEKEKEEERRYRRRQEDEIKERNEEFKNKTMSSSLKNIINKIKNKKKKKEEEENEENANI